MRPLDEPQEQAVLDVPNLLILEHRSAEALVDKFEAVWGHRPVAVALPALAPEGVAFDQQVLPQFRIDYDGTGRRYGLGEVAKEFADLGLDVVLTVIPEMTFIRADALHIVDITGDQSAAVCVGKAQAQRLLLMAAAEAFQRVAGACAASHEDVGVIGIAMDVVNLWPLGADNERITPTCFCVECRSALDRYSGTSNFARQFERFPNPWNLALKDSGTGVGHIDDIDPDMNPKNVVNLSRFRGFDDVFEDVADDDLESEAGLLLQYMRARSSQVIAFLGNFFGGVRDATDSPELARIVLMENTPYGWTTGVFMTHVDSRDVCDEIWADPSEHSLVPEEVALRSYMCRRSRYFPNHFFNALALSQSEEKRTVTGIARLEKQMLQGLLERRRRQAMAAMLRDRVDIMVLPALDVSGKAGRIGFVGSALSDSVSKRILEGAALIDTPAGRPD